MERNCLHKNGNEKCEERKSYYLLSQSIIFVYLERINIFTTEPNFQRICKIDLMTHNQIANIFMNDIERRIIFIVVTAVPISAIKKGTASFGLLF